MAVRGQGLAVQHNDLPLFLSAILPRRARI